MKEKTIKSFSEFTDEINGVSPTSLFRGISDKNFKLIPSLFRHKDLGDPKIREKNLMWVFKAQSKAHLINTPSNEIEWLTIAQHHGLPTRLLDWSLSPLVSAFFAVKNDFNKDGAICIYDKEQFSQEENINIKNLDAIVSFFPSHVTKRISAQSGMFTVHPLKNSELKKEDLTKTIIIKKEIKVEILSKLVKYGIHHSTMFPDLDGLSNYIKYLNKY